MLCWTAPRSLGSTRSRNVEMDGSALAGSNSNIRNSSGDQKHRFVTTFKAQVPVRVSLCPSAMHASLRLISAAERLCLPNRPFIRGRLIFLLLPTMRRVRVVPLYGLFRRSYPEWPCYYDAAEKLDEFPPPYGIYFPWLRTTFLKFSPIFKRELCAASQQDRRVQVRFGSKADMCAAISHVRFGPIADIRPYREIT